MWTPVASKPACLSVDPLDNQQARPSIDQGIKKISQSLSVDWSVSQ